MHIFFYTGSNSKAAVSYLKQLQNLSVLDAMTILHTKKLFPSQLALKLRSGDLIILVAFKSSDLDELLTFRSEFSDFRIILIISDNVDSRKAHLLHPRLITFQEDSIVKIESVVQKMLNSN